MKISAIDDKVIIDGFEISGHINEEQSCSTCKNHLIYYEDFDAYFCPTCNRWNESKCNVPSCMYCPNRPEVPLPHRK